MEVSGDGPYQRLAKTPLAQKHTVCGLSPAAMTIILGIISFLIDPLPNFLLVFYLYNNPLDSNAGGPPYFVEEVDKVEKKERTVILVILLVFASFHLLTIVMMMIGACINEGCCICCWLCSVIFNCFFGKFIPALILLLSGLKLAGIVLALTVINIPITVALVYCYGQISAVERNKRYMETTTETLTYTINPNGPSQVPQVPQTQTYYFQQTAQA